MIIFEYSFISDKGKITKYYFLFLALTREHILSVVFHPPHGLSFNELSVEIFQYQYLNNIIYKQFTDGLRIDPGKVTHYHQIPFLPVEFYKTHQVICGTHHHETVFKSSGTTTGGHSLMYVKDLALYEKSFTAAFRHFFGNPEDYHLLALLPGYSNESSLVYMINSLIKLTRSNLSGFYTGRENNLADVLKRKSGRKKILFGVTHSLIDFVQGIDFQANGLIVMETGGMKGRKKEMIREEVHSIIKSNLGVEKVYSEYGMTELFSQAYSPGDGIYGCPPWMKVLTRDINDPSCLIQPGKTGGINIIDLANIDTCSFIATKDLGKYFSDGNFEISGRFDNSDLRGCNLMN